MPRLFVIALTLGSFAVAAAATGAQEFPKLKPGLWSQSTTTTAAGRPKQPPQVSTLCLDESTQQYIYRMSMGMAAGLCSKHDLKVANNKVTIEAVCDLGVTRVQTTTVTTMTGDTAYRTEAHAVFDPPLKGTPRDSVTIVDGKHIGACKEGQQPGDMTLPNGQQVNIRQWMGGPKG
jgi:hypothetical protein